MRLIASRTKFAHSLALSLLQETLEGDLDDLAVLLRLHSGLEGLARDIGHGDPNDDLRPAFAGPVGHLRKTLASFGAQLFGRSALVGR